MARRIITTHKASDSSKPSDAVMAAERRAAEVGESIAVMQAHKAELEKKVAELESAVKPKLEAVSVVTEELEQVSREVEKKRAELASVGQEILEAFLARAELRAEHENKLKQETDEFLATVAVHRSSLDRTRAAVAEVERLRAVVLAELDREQDKLEGLKREAEKASSVSAELLALRNQRVVLESELLARALEVEKAKVELHRLVALQNDERVKLDESRSLRLREEQRIAELHKSLAEKENDVAQGLRQLHALKETLDTAAQRIQRRESDAVLKEKLLKEYNVRI
jgi:chromosome segregation ATPase